MSEADSSKLRPLRMREYYDRRAGEYDETSYEPAESLIGSEVHSLIAAVRALPPTRVLDVGCGTGYLTRHLEGEIVGLDQSDGMLAKARSRVPAGTFIRAEVPPLPFPDHAFGRVFTSNFYSHLESGELRVRFLREALRTADELIVVDEAWSPDAPPDGWQVRPLNDGTTWQVFKRYYRAEELAEELRGEVLLSTPTFVMVRTDRTMHFEAPAG